MEQPLSANKKIVNVGDKVYFRPPYHLPANLHWGHGVVQRLSTHGHIAYIRANAGGDVKSHVCNLTVSRLRRSA